MPSLLILSRDRALLLMSTNATAAQLGEPTSTLQPLLNSKLNKLSLIQIQSHRVAIKVLFLALTPSRIIQKTNQDLELKEEV